MQPAGKNVQTLFLAAGVLPRLVIVQAAGLIKGSATQAGLSVLPAANPAISSRDLKTASVPVLFADTQVA